MNFVHLRTYKTRTTATPVPFQITNPDQANVNINR